MPPDLGEFASLLGGCFPGGSVIRNPAGNAGGMGSTLGSGRSCGEGNGNPGGRKEMVQGAAGSRTHLNDCEQQSGFVMLDLIESSVGT